MIKVKFYRTENGIDRLKMTRYFDTIEDAAEKVEEWELRSPDNYAVYSAR